MNEILLWFIKEEGVISLEPRLKEKLLKINNDIIDKHIKIYVDLKIPKSNHWFKAKVEVNAHELIIKEIIKTLDSDTFLLTKEIDDVFNKIVNFELYKNMKIYHIPDDLFIDETEWNLINTGVDLGQYPLFIGPHGSGKTTTAYALAKVRNWDFYRLNCGALSKPKSTLVGGMQLKDGNTSFLEAEFLKHYKSEKNTIILVDELSRIASQASNFTMTMFESFDSYIYVEELGERIYKGKNVTFVAAANFGFMYSDTRNLDEAFKDRFDPFIIDYLPEEKEIDCIVSKTNCLRAVAKQLVSLANLIRKNQDTLRTGISTRKLIGLAKYSTQGWDLKTIIDKLLINLFLNGSFDNREAVRKIINTKI